MNKIKKLMINTFCVNNIDFMGYKLQKGERYSYHHIIKREAGGDKTIENGAILTKSSHKFLHIIECKDYGTYLALTTIFKLINSSIKPPTKELLLVINELLNKFENNHKNDLNAKGEPIIKQKYKKRIQKEWEKNN